MKIKFGSFITEGRGKIGGHVASRNRAGAYLRTKVTPINRNTAAQILIRGIFGSISRAWSSLTQLQRDAWNAAVVNWKQTDIFGDLKTLSGFNLHQKINIIRGGFGLPFLESPAVPDSGMQPVMFNGATINLTTGLMEANIQTPDPTGLLEGYGFQVYATPPLAPGKSFVKNDTRVIGYFSGTTFPAISEDNEFMPLDIEDMYKDTFGALTTADAGSRIYIGAKLVHLASGTTDFGGGQYFTLSV